jgi:hypothetical protein
MMETWEIFFREKSRRRRARTIGRVRSFKLAVLALLFGSIAAAVYLDVSGLAG